MIHEIFSDIGGCFTIYNKHHNLVYQTGTGYGLKLLIDTETYDFLPGVKTKLGILVSTTPSDDVQLIQDTGYAVLPGTNSLLKLSSIKVSLNLHVKLL